MLEIVITERRGGSKQGEPPLHDGTRLRKKYSYHA